METNSTNNIGIEEKLEILFKLIERYDTLRGSIANRAAIILSANAILLGATTFLIDKVLANPQQSSSTKLISILSIAATVILLALSIAYATSVIANIWRTSRNTLEIRSPDRLFFHAKETVEKFEDFNSFEEGFRMMTQDQLITYALSELWSLGKNYRRRYGIMGQAIRYFLFSIFPFVVTIGILLSER